eukprot:385721_1
MRNGPILHESIHREKCTERSHHLHFSMRHNTVPRKMQVKRIINEATAAGITYGLDKKKQGDDMEEHNLFVFDLSGGTFTEYRTNMCHTIKRSVSGRTYECQDIIKVAVAIDLTKRISLYDQVSFAQYQSIKQSYSYEHKAEKEAPEAQFVPPPPPPSMRLYGKSNQSDGMAYVDSDDTDDDETHCVGYLTG